MKIKFKNFLGTIESFFRNDATVARNYQFQDRDGTIADDTDLASKQDDLVSGTNIKTVNSNSILGSGNLAVGTVDSVSGDGVDNTDPDNPVLNFPISNEVQFTSTPNISATNVQAAIEEVDTDARAYADSLVVGLWDDRGNFDASGGAYPSSGGSGSAGAIKKGDIWTISVAGTLPTGQLVEIGDTVRAKQDTPGNTQANWAIQQNNIGYTAENSANKSTDVNADQASNTKYPSVKSVYDWAVGLFQTLSNKDANNGYAGLTLFKINFKNVLNTFTSFFTNSNTAARTYTFKDRNGTIADDTDLALKVSIGLNVIDANSATYGCVPNSPGTDNSLGIEKAIQAAWVYANANNCVAYVEFDDGEYYLTRAMQTTSFAGNSGYYCQVPLPFAPYGTSNGYSTVVIRPKYSRDYTTPVQAFYGNTVVGVVFRSTLTAQSFNATNGWPSMFGGRDPKQGQTFPTHYSFMGVEFQNITFKVPEAPTLACIQDTLITRMTYDGITGIIHKSVPANPTPQPTSPLGVFNFGSAYNNNGYFFKNNLLFIGLYSGIAVAEHTNHGGFVAIVDCWVGLKLAAPSWASGAGFFHFAQLNVVSTEGVMYGIAATDQSGVSTTTLGGNSVPGYSSAEAKIGIQINQWDIEEGGSAAWNTSAPTWHVYDPSDVISGKITYGRAKFGVGSIVTSVTYPFKQTGATYVDFKDLLTSQATSGVTTFTATVLSDNFTRANNTGSMGNLVTPVTPWLPQTGTWGIISNTAYCQSAVNSGAQVLNKTIVDAGISSYTMSFGYKLATAGDVQAIYRYTDASNYWFVDISTGNIGLYKKVAGSVTTIANLAISNATTLTYTIKIVTNGNLHTVYRNGAILSTLSALDGFNNSATLVGLGVASGAGLSGNGDRFSNFLLQTQYNIQSATWGSLNGTVTDQIDLVAYVNTSGQFTRTNTSVTATTKAMVAGEGYVSTSDGSTQLVYTLPATASVGQVFSVSGGSGTGGWRISQNASQVIKLQGTTTTTGTGGYITSGSQYDTVQLICIVANTTFVARSITGTLTVN